MSAEQRPRRIRRGRSLRLRGSAAVLTAVLLGACALGPKLDPPRLSIAGVEVVSGELWVQHVKVRMHLHNPNDRELAIAGVEYTIEIAGEEFASGGAAASFVVPPHGDADFETNATTNLARPVGFDSIRPARLVQAMSRP